MEFLDETPLGSGNPVQSTASPGMSLRNNYCDPAYPDARTCIAIGAPTHQGCGTTDEWLFTVLPPDPQALDRDEDGIGCEPMT